MEQPSGRYESLYTARGAYLDNPSVYPAHADGVGDDHLPFRIERQARRIEEPALPRELLLSACRGVHADQRTVGLGLVAAVDNKQGAGRLDDDTRWMVEESSRAQFGLSTGGGIDSNLLRSRLRLAVVALLIASRSSCYS